MYDLMKSTKNEKNTTRELQQITLQTFNIQEKGKKYVKVIDAGSVWGFVSMWEGVHKGSLVCKGDLLKPSKLEYSCKT